MKTFKKQAAQGDVMFRRIDKLPKGLESQKPENGKIIVAHSETGHNHSIVIEKANGAQLLIDKTNDFIAYLKVGENGAVIEHERSYDTHEPIKFDEGIYEVRRQREYVPEGYRKVMD